VLHAQSWDGANLGTQWEINCPTENANFLVQDNRVARVGTGGLHVDVQRRHVHVLPGGWPWGDGSGTLNTTVIITTVPVHQHRRQQHVRSPRSPTATRRDRSRTAARLTFAIGNGSGVGETTTSTRRSRSPRRTRRSSTGSCGLRRRTPSSARGAT
jgi:hypothetical protein